MRGKICPRRAPAGTPKCNQIGWKSGCQDHKLPYKLRHWAETLNQTVHGSLPLPKGENCLGDVGSGRRPEKTTQSVRPSQTKRPTTDSNKGSLHPRCSYVPLFACRITFIILNGAMSSASIRRLLTRYGQSNWTPNGDFRLTLRRQLPPRQFTFSRTRVPPE